MTVKFYGFLITMLGASVFGDKTPNLKFTKITIEPTPGNPYFENWSSEISESGDTMSMICPAKEDLPENMMFKIIVDVNGNQVFSMEMGICEGFKFGVIDQNFMDHAYPKDKFPKSCPVKAETYELRDYTFSDENIPAEVPEGDFIIRYSFYEPDSEPLITWNMEGQITYK